MASAMEVGRRRGEGKQAECDDDKWTPMVNELARKHGVSCRTIWRWWRQFRDERERALLLWSQYPTPEKFADAAASLDDWLVAYEQHNGPNE
jgi:hypothetical protein